jgi:endonuclease/exonuclease/phosphatase (EEP) superfamily protein YafD
MQIYCTDTHISRRSRPYLTVSALVLVATTWTGTLRAQESGTAAAPKGAASSLTAAFWNIQWFPAGRPDPSAIAEKRQTTAVHSEIKQLNPDIIGMEEVRNWDMAALAVQPLAGVKVDVCAKFPPREGQSEAQEVAIASRLQPISAWVEEWKRGDLAVPPPRGFAFAAYEVRPRQLLLVYCVHFKSNRGELSDNIPIREEATRQLLSHIEAMKRAYSAMGQIAWIVGGDFNTSLDDPRFGAENTLRNLQKNGFLWGWQNVPHNSRLTLHGEKNYPAASFDHIFYRGLKLRQARVIETTRESSDHKPIVATFDL